MSGLSALQVGQRLGKSKRQVHNWALAGCPHDTVTTKRGSERRFRIDEVRRWAMDKGYIEPESTGPDLFDEPEAMTFAELATALRRRISSMLRQRDESTATQAREWATAAAKLSGELRQVEQRIFELQVREGAYIDRGAAGRLLAELTRMVAGLLDTIAVDLADGVAMALAGDGLVDAERIDACKRVCAITVRETVDDRRRRAAEQIEAAVKRLEAA
jgi:hypothetical protein